MRVIFHSRLRYRRRWPWPAAAAGLLTALVCFPALTAFSANGDCGIPVTSGALPKTSDCLFILRVGVGIGSCAPCVCNTNDTAGITAGDALLCLKAAVGQNVTLVCPPCPETTTTTTLPITTTTVADTTTTLPDTTTTLPDTTTTLPDTTTTTLAVTTTTDAPTTTLAPSGPCPVSAEWITHAAYGDPCASNSDCDAGSCDAASHRCHAQTDFDFGWSGHGHDSDLGEGSVLKVAVDCAAGGAPCGQCTISGIDPSSGSCRCANDFRTLCDQPLTSDAGCPACFAGAFVGSSCATNADCSAGDCGKRCANDFSVTCTRNSDCPGSTCLSTAKCSNGKNCFVQADCTGTCPTTSNCLCYDGPPLALSVSASPFCILQRIDSVPSGTLNVDSGASSVTTKLGMLMFNAISSAAPCPICGGHCSNDAGAVCTFDSDCAPGGTCQLDPAAGDGVRGGVCIGGRSDGLPCDVEATNASLPPAAAGATGAGTSLDCAPDQTKAIGGLALTVAESTDDSSLAATLSCGGSFPDLNCPCLICSGSPATPCHSDADCAPDKGSCSAGGTSFPLPNACDDGLCSGSGADASCSTGPDDPFCDGLLRADGRGVVPCASNADCSAAGAGDCSLLQRRDCFADPILADGSAHPFHPTSSAAFCVAATTNAARNELIGLPGPARLRRQSTLRSWCAGNSGQTYSPGSGGCPP